MSPTISAVAAIQPKPLCSVKDGAGGGATFARGLPRLVTRMGSPVRRTFSRTARHVALNFETVIVSTA